MKTRLSCTLGYCLIAATASLCFAQQPAGASKKLRARLGDEMVAVFRAPTKVEVFRLDPKYTGKKDEQHFFGYMIKATGKEQGTEFGKRLGDALLQDKAWFNPQRFSPDNPAVGYRIWKDKQAVEVVYDTTARISARLVAGNAKQKDGVCDPVHAAFAKLAVEAFPDDKELAEVAKRVK